jgi:hypothetical protein
VVPILADTPADVVSTSNRVLQLQQQQQQQQQLKHFRFI